MATDSNGDYIPGSRLSKGPVSRYAYKNKTSFTVDVNSKEYVENYSKIDWSKNGREEESKDTTDRVQKKGNKKPKGKGKAKDK